MIKVLIALATFIHPMFAYAKPNFMISCRAHLVSSEGFILLESISQHFVDETKDYANSRCTIALGESPYRLLAGMQAAKPFSSNSLQSTLSIEFFSGNPVSGKLNRIRVQGLRLEDWQVQQGQSFFGEEFISVEIDGKSYSRVDYVCRLTRVM